MDNDDLGNGGRGEGEGEGGKGTGGMGEGTGGSVGRGSSVGEGEGGKGTGGMGEGRGVGEGGTSSVGEGRGVGVGSSVGEGRGGSGVGGGGMGGMGGGRGGMGGEGVVMPFKTCPKCQKPTGPRTLKCECGHEFRKAQAFPFGKDRPAPRVENIPPAKIVMPTDILYDAKHTAVLANGAIPVGEQRPLATIRLTQAALELLNTGRCVSATFKGEPIYLDIQVLKEQ